MQDNVCLDKFEKYLTDVKKASANTLASYMRDVRQLHDYVNAHDLPGLADLDDGDLVYYLVASQRQITCHCESLHSLA